MKVLIGCDVDPVPPVLARPPRQNVWACLDGLELFVEQWGAELPPITWLIRADEYVKLATGDWTSGYTYKTLLWQTLLARGHELGWHMHHMSFDSRRASFGFDPDPPWLTDAYHALSKYFDVKVTRTGWDYGSSLLFRHLDNLGIVVDFSALPGNLAWFSAGHNRLVVDWTRCPSEPYHPHTDDYQRRGGMGLLEIPITQFVNPLTGMAKRAAWRLRNGSASFAGLRNKTKLLTQRWSGLPPPARIWSFYFHPEDLHGDGATNMLRNLKMVRSISEAEFVVASATVNFL